MSINEELVKVLKEVRLNQKEQLELTRQVLVFIEELKNRDSSDLEVGLDKESEVIIKELTKVIKPIDIKVDTIRETLTLKLDDKVLQQVQESIGNSEEE